MKGKELFDIINDIDERFVQELYEEPVRAEVYRLEKRRGGWIMPTLAGAACLAVIVGATAAVRFGGKEQFTSDREFPDGKPDWVYDGAASGGESYGGLGVVTGKYKGYDGIEKYIKDYYPDNANNCLIFACAGDIWRTALDAPYYEGANSCIIQFGYDGDDAPVYAMDGGEVVYAGKADCGGLIIIKHSDDYYSLYGYIDLDKTTVSVGDVVAMGQIIASGGDMDDYNHVRANGGAGGNKYRSIWNFDSEPTVDMWNRYIAELVDLELLYDALEKTAETPEEWASRPHVKPTKNTPDGFDFFNTGDKDVYGSNVTTIPAANGEEVYAVDDGEVVFADWYYGGGKTVVIKHPEEIYKLYCHLNRDLDYPVKVGDVVKAGQLIGYAGSTGEADRICVGYGRRSEMVKIPASETVQKTLDVEAAKKLGSDTPFKEDLCYIAVEFPDGTKRYFKFKDNLPEEFDGVNLSLYDIIKTIEPGTGEYYEEEIEGGIMCGYR